MIGFFKDVVVGNKTLPWPLAIEMVNFPPATVTQSFVTKMLHNWVPSEYGWSVMVMLKVGAREPTLVNATKTGPRV